MPRKYYYSSVHNRKKMRAKIKNSKINKNIYESNQSGFVGNLYESRICNTSQPKIIKNIYNTSRSKIAKNDYDGASRREELRVVKSISKKSKPYIDHRTRSIPKKKDQRADSISQNKLEIDPDRASSPFLMALVNHLRVKYPDHLANLPSYPTYDGIKFSDSETLSLVDMRRIKKIRVIKILDNMLQAQCNHVLGSRDMISARSALREYKKLWICCVRLRENYLQYVADCPEIPQTGDPDVSLFDDHQIPTATVDLGYDYSVKSLFLDAFL